MSEPTVTELELRMNTGSALINLLRARGVTVITEVEQ